MQRQRQLSFRKAVRIAWKSIRVRWWRSLLVTTGIILALAFLMYVSYSDALRQGVPEYGSPELQEALRRQGIDLRPDDMDARIQTRWMLGLALLISFVGILNAMVLNVTERFREIGTMKCLGAQDGFVVRLYLIESVLQGLGGAVAGICIGWLLAFLEGVGVYGIETVSLVPFTRFMWLLSSCLLAGVLLSVGGALYPARLAARMKPVDAMSSEV